MCDFCFHEFKSGSGHLCWCEECSKKHPMCNKCYNEAIRNGQIRNTPQNRMRYNDSTLEKGK